MKRGTVIILDPAHGANVKGKCSPDGRHHEFMWSRDRVKAIKRMLTDLDFEVYVTTESDDEPGLVSRKNFATQICKGRRKLLLSLHNNAAGDGSKWMDARGVEVYTTPGITKADICADYIFTWLGKDFPGVRLRFGRNKPLYRDKEAKFVVLNGDDYMGVLVEWLFQDNKEDVELLMSDNVNRKFESSIVRAIVDADNYFTRQYGA